MDGRPPITPASFELHEQKYELDSLAAVLKLAAAYYKETKDNDCFLQEDRGSSWLDAMQLIVDTIVEQQKGVNTPVSIN